MKTGLLTLSFVFVSAVFSAAQDVAVETSSAYCLTPVVLETEVEEFQKSSTLFKEMSKEECENELRKLKATSIKKWLMVNNITWDLVRPKTSPEPSWDRILVQVSELQLQLLMKRCEASGLTLTGLKVNLKNETGCLQAFDFFKKTEEDWSPDLIVFRNATYAELRKLARGTANLVRVVQIDNQSVIRTSTDLLNEDRINIYVSGGRVVWATKG